MPIESFEIQFVKDYELAPSVKHFIFDLVQPNSLSFIPGQFIRIHFKDNEGREVKRSYSLANQHSPSSTIEFAASFVPNGLASERLFNLTAGDRFTISGPVGKLVLNNETDEFKRHIFVATGTGVTPFLSMLPQLNTALENNTIHEVIILQGIRKREDLLYGKEFRAFGEQTGAAFTPCFSQEPKGSLEKGEASGYVQQQFNKLSLDPTTDKVYLCGNPAMIDEAFKYLKENKFTNKQIVREKYISSK